MIKYLIPVVLVIFLSGCMTPVQEIELEDDEILIEEFTFRIYKDSDSHQCRGTTENLKFVYNGSYEVID